MNGETDRLLTCPKGWVAVALGDVAWPSDEKVNPASAQDMPYIGLEHIAKGSGKLLARGHASDVTSTKTRFRTGDLLYARLRPYLNKAHVVDCDGICSTDFLVFPVNPLLSSKLILYRILCSDFVAFASRNMSGVQHPRVSFDTMSRFTVLLPPLSEQQRIVAKMEELVTRLDAGVEALTKIKTQLKRYRQAILKHAFEGKLTAEWREAHRDELEPASVLLERIKQERRQRASGDYKELAPLAISDLPELPDGWVWTITSEVCSSVRDGTHDTPKYVEEGVPLVTSKNLGEHGLEFAAARSISIEDHRMISVRSRVDEGDILLAMIGTIGNPVVVRTSRTFSIKNVGLFKKNAAYLNSEYLCFWLAGRAFSGILEEKKLIKGTTQRFIPLGYLRILPVPLTSLLEQHRIVEEIERRFSVADRTEKTVDQGLKQAERLRQSILKRAFEGKLVPQDPNDEPAERLLDRIREERASLQAGTKSIKAARKKATAEEMRLM